MPFDPYDIALIVLFLLLLWTGIALLRRGRRQDGDPYPYRLAEPLDKLQRRWLLVVCAAVGDRYCVSAAHPLELVVSVDPELAAKRREHYGRKLQDKQVDFLLCDPASGEPRAAVLLARSPKDSFREHVLLAAGLAVVRLPGEPVLAPAELRLELFDRAGLDHRQESPGESDEWVLGLVEENGDEEWAVNGARSRRQPAGNGQPAPCPSCGAPQRVRRASNGEHAGREFLVCSRYPDCRQLHPLN